MSDDKEVIERAAVPEGAAPSASPGALEANARDVKNEEAPSGVEGQAAPAPTPQATPDEANVKALLDYLRLRTARLEKSYYQQEARAQFLLGITVAVSTALLAAIGEDPALLLPKLGVLIPLALPLLATLLLASTAFMPLNGRTLTSFLDEPLTWIGLFHLKGTKLDKYRGKPADEERLLDFAEERFFPGSRDVLKSIPRSTRQAELSLLWSQWFVMERKAGLLRWAIRSMVVALICAGAAYFSIKSTIRSASRASEIAPSATLPALAASTQGSSPSSAPMVASPPSSAPVVANPPSSAPPPLSAAPGSALSTPSASGSAPHVAPSTAAPTPQ